MRALQITAANQLGLAIVPDPIPQPGEALVEVQTAALNHRDVWIKLGQYAGLKYPCIPGSDAAGIVVAVGSDGDRSWVGREIVINPALDWGGSPAAQGSSFSILGLPRAGTLAEKVSVPVSQLSEKPAHLGWPEAAALPLAGLTAYRALFSRARLQAGERVLITGIGGGVALLALQFAAAAGAEVWVTSSSETKIARATQLGAKGGFNYNQDGWTEDAADTPGAFDVIVESAGGEGFEQLIDLAAPGGRVVVYGATRGNAPGLPLRKLFWRQVSLLGTTMGSPADWAAMLEWVATKRVTPVVSEIFTFDRALEAFALMEHGAQFGKIVVQLDR